MLRLRSSQRPVKADVHSRGANANAEADELVVLDGDRLESKGSVDLRPALNRKSKAEAALSGVAVGEVQVYPTLEIRPYVLLVERP